LAENYQQLQEMVAEKKISIQTAESAMFEKLAEDKWEGVDS
jgi:hypothetical protein